jgi:autotransporter adhesin
LFDKDGFSNNKITLSSTDAVNGSQLYATNKAVDTLISTNGETPLTAFSINYDKDGNIASFIENNVTYTITRDDIDRLDTISNGTITLKAVYDDTGIFTGMSEVTI